MRKPYPTDVSDDEWAFVATYLPLMTEDAPQRDYALREVFNGLRWIARSAAQWGMMPNYLPPWYTVYKQTQRRFSGRRVCKHRPRSAQAVARNCRPGTAATRGDLR